MAEHEDSCNIKTQLVMNSSAAIGFLFGITTEIGNDQSNVHAAVSLVDSLHGFYSKNEETYFSELDPGQKRQVCMECKESTSKMVLLLL